MKLEPHCVAGIVSPVQVGLLEFAAHARVRSKGNHRDRGNGFWSRKCVEIKQGGPPTSYL